MLLPAERLHIGPSPESKILNMNLIERRAGKGELQEEGHLFWRVAEFIFFNVICLIRSYVLMCVLLPFDKIGQL